jgi:hypothetical protein
MQFVCFNPTYPFGGPHRRFMHPAEYSASGRMVASGEVGKNRSHSPRKPKRFNHSGS